MHIIVPPGIVAVPRRSPLPIRKRTPWHPHPDGTVATERAGAREWFSDRIFVEAQPAHRRTGYGTSTTVHSCAIVLLIGLVARPGQILPVRVAPSLVMPAMMSMPVIDVPVTKGASRTYEVSVDGQTLTLTQKRDDGQERARMAFSRQ